MSMMRIQERYKNGTEMHEVQKWLKRNPTTLFLKVLTKQTGGDGSKTRRVSLSGRVRVLIVTLSG